LSVVLVAGGASGIGRAAALAFCAQGDDVLLVDHDSATAQAVVDALGVDSAPSGPLSADRKDGHAASAAGRTPPGRLITWIGDLADPDSARQAVKEAVLWFGALDCVFTTAARLSSMPLAEWTALDWERSLALNLSMPFWLTQAAAPELARSSNASVIFTSSTGALRGHAGMPAYHATKAGLLGLCRSLADELAPCGIRVNCLLPGWIDTPFNDPYWSFQQDTKAAAAGIAATIPMKRQGTPDDVVGAVLFLASPASRYVTGTSLTVDGGYTAV
jgi:3-oxoacyl-[acyl-carrier protein] reductase